VVPQDGSDSDISQEILPEKRCAECWLCDANAGIEALVQHFFVLNRMSEGSLVMFLPKVYPERLATRKSNYKNEIVRGYAKTGKN
jgi:hypothetical protein